MGSERSNSSNSKEKTKKKNESKMPDGVQKIIDSIREIIGNKCTDSEIYQVLRDCDMDPNDAVQILLSQDAFHEVKSKRERRKEMKEKQEYKSENSDSACCGVKIGTGYGIESEYAREDMSFSSSNISSLSLTCGLRTMNEQLSPHRSQTVGTGAIFSSEQTSGGSQAAFVGGPSGHVSMADVVRVDRLHTRDSHIEVETSYTLKNMEVWDPLYCQMKLSHDSSPSPQDHDSLHSIDLSETIHQSGVTMSQQNFEDEWPAIKQRIIVNESSNWSSHLNISMNSGTGLPPHQSHFFGDGTTLPENCPSKEVQVSDRIAVTTNFGSNNVESDSLSIEQENAYGFVGASPRNDGSFKDTISYDSHRCMNELHEGRGSGSDLSFKNGSVPLNNEISSTSVSLQKLSLGKEEIKAAPLSENNNAVVFPSYMQELSANCSHLSFGTYKSLSHTSISCPPVSNPLKSNLEVSAAIDGSSSVGLKTRNSGYLGGSLCTEQLGSMSHIPQLIANVGLQDLPVSSQVKLRRQNIHEIYSAYDCISPKSVPKSSLKNIQEPRFPFSRMIDPKTRNLTHLDLQPSSPPVLDESLASGVQFARDFDGACSSFAVTHPLTTRDSNILSGDRSTSLMKESYSSTLSDASLAGGHALSQHLSTHSTTSSLAGYSAVPQLYHGTSSAFEQGYQDNSIFFEPLASVNYNNRQLKGVSSSSSFPLSNANVSGYGFLGNPTNFSGSFLNDLMTTSNASAVGYDDCLAQYGGNNFTLLQPIKNDSFSSSDYEPGLRTLSTVPKNKYYNLQGQGTLHQRQTLSTCQQVQPLSAYQQSLSNYSFQQGQQLSQNYGAVGYTNFYNSQRRSLLQKPW